MKKYITSMSVVALTAMLVGTFALAADTGSVSATVTKEVIAVTVTSGVIAYLTVATTQDTTNSGVNDTKTITNTGTVAEDFEIKGQNSTGNVWALAGAGGSAAYAHKTCIATCDVTPSWVALTTGYVDLDTNKAISATTDLDLEVTVPTSNEGTGEATLPVDILATKH